MAKRPEVVVVLSGGMDSATLLYLINQGYDPICITFDYGQRHYREIEYAESLANKLSASWMLYNMQDYGSVARSALTDYDQQVPEGHYAADNMKKTVVPNRNMTMLSIATAMAISNKAVGVATGVHAGDHAIYPDCRLEFIVHMESTVKIANEGFIDPKFQIMAPFLNITKADIVTMGTQFEVPYDKTWSCYKGNLKHCGKCGTCVERKEAFYIANVPDPTEYEETGVGGHYVDFKGSPITHEEAIELHRNLNKGI